MAKKLQISDEFLELITNRINTIYSEYFENSTVANNTLTNVGEMTLPKGTYIIMGFGSFGSNATGNRQLGIGSSESGGNYDRSTGVTVASVSGSATSVQVIAIISINTSVTFYLKARQNSGSSLSFTYGGLKAIKLK